MSVSSKYILAIDLGTSGPKVALITTYGEVVDFEFQEVALLLLPKGGAEQNPDEWWNVILATAKRVLSKNLKRSLDGMKSSSAKMTAVAN